MEPMNRQVPNMRQALGRKGVRPQMGGPAGGQGGFPPMPGGGQDIMPGGRPPGGRPQSPPNPNPGGGWGGYQPPMPPGMGQGGPKLGMGSNGGPQSSPNPTPGGGYSNHLYNPPQMGGNQNIGAQPKPGMGPNGGPQQGPTMPPGQQPPGPPTQIGGPRGGGQGQLAGGLRPGNFGPPSNQNPYEQWKQGQGGGQQQPGVRPDGSYPGPIVDGKQTYIKDGQVVGYDEGGTYTQTGGPGANGGFHGQGGWQMGGMTPGIGSAPQQYPQGTYY